MEEQLPLDFDSAVTALSKKLRSMAVDFRMLEHYPEFNKLSLADQSIFRNLAQTVTNLVIFTETYQTARRYMETT